VKKKKRKEKKSNKSSVPLLLETFVDKLDKQLAFGAAD
jgi:hypothetical protein